MARRRRFREHPKCLSEEHLQSWRSRLHLGNEQGPGELSAPPCLPFHAPRFAAGQRLGCHAGWSWPCIPSSAAARHSQILQPSLVHTRRCRWQGRQALAALGQRWVEEEGTEPLVGLLCWRGTDGASSFWCIRGTCATSRGVEKSLGSPEEKSEDSACQKCKLPFGPISPDFLTVWMENFGFQG